MEDINEDIVQFYSVAQRDPALYWFAVADSAQSRQLPSALIDKSRKLKCLLGASLGSPLAQYSPHLIEMPSPSNRSQDWSWIRLHARSAPCVSILASHLPFDDTFNQLSVCANCRLPDGDEMFLAYWDPAILGTLMGQEDDLMLHVKGPVLDFDQRATLTEGMMAWWYWGRTGALHCVAPVVSIHQVERKSLNLSQRQVDDLIEASTPDQVIYYVHQNNPDLFFGLGEAQKYKTVRGAVNRARDIGLNTMRDLVNYACIELVYKDRIWEEPAIIGLINQIKCGEISLDEASERFP